MHFWENLVEDFKEFVVGEVINGADRFITDTNLIAWVKSADIKDIADFLRWLYDEIFNKDKVKFPEGGVGNFVEYLKRKYSNEALSNKFSKYKMTKNK